MTTVDLLVRIAAVPSSAAEAAALPSKHGHGAAGALAKLLPVAVVADAAGAPRAPLYLSHAIAKSTAQALVVHSRHGEIWGDMGRYGEIRRRYGGARSPMC